MAAQTATGTRGSRLHTTRGGRWVVRLVRVALAVAVVLTLVGIVPNVSGGRVASQVPTATFGAKTDFGTGITPFSVATGDFNGDGKPDLATANSTGNSVSVLLGNGTFGAKTDFAMGSGPYSVAVGDFSGDGKTDLATANNGGGDAPRDACGAGNRRKRQPPLRRNRDLRGRHGDCRRNHERGGYRHCPDPHGERYDGSVYRDSGSERGERHDDLYPDEWHCRDGSHGTAIRSDARDRGGSGTADAGGFHPGRRHVAHATPRARTSLSRSATDSGRDSGR